MNDTGPHVVDRDESINWFRETRRRTAGLFGLLIPGSGCEVAFAAGESIWTESSHEYERAGLVAWGTDLGLARHDQWVDEEAGFAVTAFDAVGFRPGSSPS